MAACSVSDFRLFLFLYFILVFIFCNSSCQERQLVAKVNPGCPSARCNESVVEVMHVRADGPYDTMHYVWCFHSKPSVLVARTSHATNLSVSWEDFPNGASSISFTPKPHYSFGVLINQIFEFNDVNDTGFFDMSNNSGSYIQKLNAPDSWEMKLFQQNQDSVRLVMDGSWKKEPLFVMTGFIRVELETYGKQDHGSKLPHLLHSSNATQIELSLFNLTTRSGFQQNRFAVELVVAANESVGNHIFNESSESLDDEYCPGVFTLVDLQTTASKKTGNGGYLQWRPVAYVAEERDIVTSTETAFYSVKNIVNSSSECEGTLLAAFFGTDLNTSLLNALNVSFGATNDGFYSLNKASIWSFTMGYGHPPDESISMLVILVVTACLGSTAVLIVVSGCYFAFRLISFRKDDLLLSE